MNFALYFHSEWGEGKEKVAGCEQSENIAFGVWLEAKERRLFAPLPIALYIHIGWGITQI